MASVSHRTAILMSAFAVFSYVVVHHLAHVELWDSSRAISHGLTKPPGRVVAVILYPVLDVLALSAAFFAMLFLTHHGKLGWQGTKELWLILAPAAVGIPFLAVAAIRTYRRVWGRARVSEYALLTITVMLAIPIGVFCCDFLDRALQMYSTSSALMYAGLALPAVIGVRMAPRLIQDTVALSHRARANQAGVLNVLLYGAGFTSTVCLRAHSFVSVQKVERVHIVGFIDDDTNMRDRIVHGHKVLGTFEELPHLLKHKTIDAIVLTSAMSDTRRIEVLGVCREYDVAAYEWQHGFSELSHESIGIGETPLFGGHSLSDLHATQTPPDKAAPAA